MPIADVLAGVHGAAGVSAALAGRERSGRGVVVRTSLLAAAISAHTFQGTKWTVGGQVAQRSGNQHPQIAPTVRFVAETAMSRSRSAASRCGRGSRRSPGSTVMSGVSRPTPTGWPIAKNRDRRSGVRSPGPHDFADLEAAGVPSGAIRTIDEVYEWTRPAAKGY